MLESHRQKLSMCVYVCVCVYIYIYTHIHLLMYGDVSEWTDLM